MIIIINNFIVIFYLFYNGNMSYTFFLFRSSHRRCALKRDILKNFEKFKGKHMCQFQAFRFATLSKRDSSTGVYVWIFRIYKNTFLTKYLSATASVFSIQLPPDPQKELLSEQKLFSILVSKAKTVFSGRKCFQPIEYFSGNSCQLWNLASLHKKWSFPSRISFLFFSIVMSYKN